MGKSNESQMVVPSGPAQGQTTDSAHLIVAEHATQEGSYVALTRARHRTDVYAHIDEDSVVAGPNQLVSLAEWMPT